MKFRWRYCQLNPKRQCKLPKWKASRTYSNSIQPSPNCIDIFLNCFRVCLAIKSWNFCFAAYCVMILNDSKKTIFYESVVERMSTTKNNCLHLFPWYKKRPLQNYDCFNGFTEKNVSEKRLSRCCDSENKFMSLSIFYTSSKWIMSRVGWKK